MNEIEIHSLDVLGGKLKNQIYVESMRFSHSQINISPFTPSC